MTYKNELKEYVISAIIFGGCMGLFTVIAGGNVAALLTTTIVSGTAFSVLIYLFSQNIEKKFATLRADIEQSRTVYCDGSANLGKTGGWLIMTELGLEFYSHSINFEKTDTLIPFDMIIRTEVKLNKLTVHTQNGSPVFVVCKAKEWEKEIQKRI